MFHQNVESQKTCSQGRPGADPGNVSAFPPPVPHLRERGGGGWGGSGELVLDLLYTPSGQLSGESF